MKKRKNTEVVVRDTNYDAPLFDFTEELFLTQKSIKRYRAEIEFADEWDIKPDSVEELFNSLSDLQTLKDILRGHFDILVIFEGMGEKK